MTANRTDTFLNPTITQSNLVNAIQTAFINAGFTSTYDLFTSGTDQCLVFEFLIDSSKAFGRLYLRIRVTTGLVIGQQIFTAWNPTTHVGTNGSTESTYSAFSTSTTITLTALNGASEYKLVALSQSTALIMLGIIAPATKPGWWDLNSWAYGFYFTNSSLTNLRGVATAAFPYSSSDLTPSLVGSTSMSTVNTQTNKPDIIKGFLLLSSSTGIGGQTSEDFCIGAFSGQTRLATVTPVGATQQYLVIANITGGLGVRIV